MPVATIDTFKRILLKPDNVTLEANVVGDSLSFVAGSGITLTANGNLDEITITNSASLGLVTLDNVLLAGNTSTRTATVGRLNVDNIVIDSNAIQFSDSTVQNTAWTGLPTASNSVLGGVKIDASSITINGGVISVPAVATIGQTNGIATLGSDGKLTSAQIPTSLSGAIVFKGTWNASTNTPTLVDGTGQNGWQYAVAVAGTVNLGSGSLSFVPGDFIIYNGSIWQKIAANTIAAAGTLTGSTLASGVTASSLTSVGTLINLTVTNIISGSINGNAGTVTNGVYTTDTGTVTNTMLSGSIANAKLTNSTISGKALGTNLDTLTLNTSGTGLSGSTTYNGSGAATFTVASNATSVNTVSAIVARDANGDFSAGTITATITGSVSGNAGTVTNGVYTTGSYADPSWITSLAASKVGLANVTNESKATMFASPTFTGTVSGVTKSHVGLGSVENTALSTWAGSTSITSLGTVTVGSAPASDVYAWAKAATKPSYTATEVGLGSVTNESKATMFASPTFTGTVAGVTATHVGLGSVTNESKATMFASPTFTGTVAGVTATHVGLGSVNNTADANKSVSYAATAGSATTAGTVTTAAQPNITSVGTLTTLTVANAGTSALTVGASGGASYTTLAVRSGTGYNSTIIFESQKALGGDNKYAFLQQKGQTGNNFNGHIFVTVSTGNGTYSDVAYFNPAGVTITGAITTNAITTGSNVTAGTITGDWTLTGSISGVTATMVGLGSVNNTADASKSVSYAATAGGAPATDVYAWAKAATKPSYTATEVGLGNVNNTADANKSVSSASTAGTATNHYGAGGSYIASSNSGTSYGSAIQVREAGLGGAQGSAIAYAPRLGFHWSGVVASSIVMEASGRIGIVNNPGTAYEAFVCGTLTASNFSGTSSGTNTGDQTIPTTLPASDVYAWAKAATKPSYTATEVGLGNVTNESKATMFASPTFTGTVNVSGDIVATGNITAYSTSDIRLKENIQLIPNALGKLEQIRGVTFDWTAEEISRRGGEDPYFVRKHDVGVIAQEIEMVLPEIVGTRDNGMKAVQYEKLTALLIESVKELSAKVTSLEQELNLLRIK